MNPIKKVIAFLSSKSRKKNEYEFYNQELVCSRYAERNELKITKVFRECSNKIKLQYRPKLEKAVRYAIENKMPIFLVTDKEVISKDPSEAETIISTLEKNEVKVIIAEA